jgi:hypothetical protein
MPVCTGVAESGRRSISRSGITSRAEVGDFLVRDLKYSVRSPAEFVSQFLLLFTATDLPLEVALNQAWGAREDRSYRRNQLVSLGPDFRVRALAMIDRADSRQPRQSAGATRDRGCG